MSDLLLDASATRIFCFLLLMLPSFVVCVLVTLLCFLTLRKTSSTNLPPGPPSLPIIGHLHLLGEFPHQSLLKLAKIYGPLMRLRLGSVPAVVASNPEMARAILQTHELAFASRPPSSVAKYCLFDCSDIGFAPYGPYWKLVRQFCAAGLFSAKTLEASRPLRQEEMLLLAQSIFMDFKMGKAVPIRSRLLATANNIISRMALRKRFSELGVASCQDPSANIMDLLNEVVSLIGVFNIGDFVPYLQWMDLQGYVKRMKTVGRKFKTIFQEVIDVRRDLRRVDSSPPNNLLDVLLSHAENNSLKDVSITDDNIKAILVNMFAAGTDTASTTVEWVFAELFRNPAIVQHLQTELDSQVGKERFVEESDIANLPYLRAVVKETMRLHPPETVLPRKLSTAIRIANYDLGEGTTAFINVYAIGRDPIAWQSPLEFKPERFLGSDIDVRGQHFELLPFGAGRRGCPGMMLGMTNVHLMLATLVQGFDWTIPPSPNYRSKSLEQIDLSEKFGLTVVMANPLLAMPTPRLPLHLYATMTQKQCTHM